MNAARRLLSAPVLLAVLAAMACDDDGPTTPPAASSRPATVLLDTRGALEAASAVDADTFVVVVPRERVLGVIIDAPDSIAVGYGPGIVYSTTGSSFAAIMMHVGAGERQLVVRHMSGHFVEIPYRLRVVAVDTMPEHTAARLSRGGGFSSEWIDPPLDLDVYRIDFDAGDRFFVEAQSEDDDVRVSARVITPNGVVYFPIGEAGTEVTRSAVYRVNESAEHTVMMYSAGLDPDVEGRYRFRVMEADVAGSASADP